MSIFKNLENSELFAILESNSIKDIVEILGNHVAKDELRAYARRHYTAKLDPNTISGALFFSLNDIASFSFLTLLTLIGNITLPMLALSIVTGGFAAATAALSTLFFIAFVIRQNKSIEDAEKFFDFATIKSKCAEKLIKRQRLELHDIIERKNLRIIPDEAVKLHDKKPFVYVDKERFLHVTDAIAAATLTGTMLFGTYFLGIASVLTAFGAVAASAAMTGPIGLPIAGAIALGIAIFCFVKAYKSVVNADHVEKQQAHAGKEFERARLDCYNLHKKIDELSNIEEHDMPAANPGRSHSDPHLYHRKTFPDALETASHHNFFMMQRGNRMRRHSPQKQLGGTSNAPTKPKF